MNVQAYNKAIAAAVVVVVGYLGQEYSPEQVQTIVSFVSAIAVPLLVYLIPNKPTE